MSLLPQPNPPETPDEPRPDQLVVELRNALHDLNNALTPILANIQFARVSLQPTGEVREAMDDAIIAAGRANMLVMEMRGLTKQLQTSISGRATHTHG